MSAPPGQACQRREGCTELAVVRSWVFMHAGVAKLWLCGACCDELTQNGHDRSAAEIGRRAAAAEPPEGCTVEAIGGRLDGQRWHRRDTTDPVLVAFGDAAQWWDEIEAMYTDWLRLRAEVIESGGHLRTVEVAG